MKFFLPKEQFHRPSFLAFKHPLDLLLDWQDVSTGFTVIS